MVPLIAIAAFRPTLLRALFPVIVISGSLKLARSWRGQLTTCDPSLRSCDTRCCAVRVPRCNLQLCDRALRSYLVVRLALWMVSMQKRLLSTNHGLASVDHLAWSSAIAVSVANHAAIFTGWLDELRFLWYSALLEVMSSFCIWISSPAPIKS